MLVSVGVAASARTWMGAGVPVGVGIAVGMGVWVAVELADGGVCDGAAVGEPGVEKPDGDPEAAERGEALDTGAVGGRRLRGEPGLVGERQSEREAEQSGPRTKADHAD